MFFVWTPCRLRSVVGDAFCLRCRVFVHPIRAVGPFELRDAILLHLDAAERISHILLLVQIEKTDL